jgi:hypothetical protein
MYEIEAFPSPTFQAELRSAAKRIDKSRAEIEALQERLPKLRRNSEALEVAGQDPKAEIAKTTAQISEAETDLSSAKDSLCSLFAGEKNRYYAIRQRLWERVYLDSIETTTAQVALLCSALRKISDQLAGLKLPPVDDTVSSSTLDAGVATLNALVAEHKMPSNHLIDPSTSLAFSFGHALREMLKTSDLDAALKKIREDLEALSSNRPISQFEPAVANPPGSRKLWAGH